MTFVPQKLDILGLRSHSKLRLGVLGWEYAAHLYNTVYEMKPWETTEQWEAACAFVAPYMYAHDPRVLPAAKLIASYFPEGKIRYPGWALEIKEILWEQHLLGERFNPHKEAA